MRALLLSGGLGLRLKPLTDYIPKCLVPIHGRPLLDYWLDNLLNNGIGGDLDQYALYGPISREIH